MSHDCIVFMSSIITNFIIGSLHVGMMDLYASNYAKITKFKIWYRGIFAPADSVFAPAKNVQDSLSPRRTGLRPGESGPEPHFAPASSVRPGEIARLQKFFSVLQNFLCALNLCLMHSTTLASCTTYK